MKAQLHKFIAILTEEVGYCEKNTDAYLDDKKVNAGYNNFTKYGKWIGMNGKYAYWCHMLISWAANKAGISTSIIPKTASCAVGRDFFMKKGRWHYRLGYTPKRGDIVYFTTKGYPNGSGHVGVVYKIANGCIYTIEGNTSAGNSVVDNGGEVCYKSYPMTHTAIYGYGSPAYLEQKVKEKDDEVVQQINVLINGTEYVCDVINKNNTNYIKLRDFEKAGFTVVFEDTTKRPAITSPQQRAYVPQVNAETQAQIDYAKDHFDIGDSTIEYIRKYLYGDDLLRKLASA